MDEQTQQLLQKLGITANNASGAMQQLIAALGKTASASNNQTNAATLTAQSLQQMQSSVQATASNFRNVLSIGTGVVSGFTSLTSSVYGAEKAFTSVIPALDFITNTFTKSVTAAGQVLSGFSIAGFSFGRASEAAAAGVSATFEILSNAIKFQIESAQKVSDQFLALSKVGANFGARITTMAADAAGLRIPLLEFGRIITRNAENIAKLGKRIEEAGYEVANYSSQMYTSSDALVALYGNIENISVGVSDFLALQAQLGMTDDKRRQDMVKQSDAVKEYLFRQKELTALTGQSADALKKAEEERRRDLAYQMKVSRMSTTAQSNIAEGFAIAQSKFGDEAAQYLKEYVRTQGKITDPAMISFAAGNQEVARTMQMFAENVNLSTTDFRKTYAGFIKENAGAYRGFAESIEDLAELPPSLMNNFVQSQTRMGASLIANQNFFEQLPATVDKMIKEGLDIRSVITDPATKAFVDAERARSKVQQEIDATVLKNMQTIGSTMDFLNQATLSFVRAQDGINALIQKLKEAPMAADQFKDYVGTKIVDEIFRRLNLLPPVRSNNNPSAPEGPGGGAPVQPGNLGTPGAQGPIPAPPTLAQANPTTPNTQTASSAALERSTALLVAQATTRDNETARINSEIESRIAEMRSQLAAATNSNNNTAQLVAALDDQNRLMKGLNDKMDRMVDSNGRIFEALA